MTHYIYYSLNTGLVGLLITVGFLVIMSSVEHNGMPMNINSSNLTKAGICKCREPLSIIFYVSQQKPKMKQYVFKAIFFVCFKEDFHFTTETLKSSILQFCGFLT